MVEQSKAPVPSTLKMNSSWKEQIMNELLSHWQTCNDGIIHTPFLSVLVDRADRQLLHSKFAIFGTRCLPSVALAFPTCQNFPAWSVDMIAIGMQDNHLTEQASCLRTCF